MNLLIVSPRFSPSLYLSTARIWNQGKLVFFLTSTHRDSTTRIFTFSLQLQPTNWSPSWLIAYLWGLSRNSGEFSMFVKPISLPTCITQAGSRLDKDYLWSARTRRPVRSALQINWDLRFSFYIRLHYNLIFLDFWYYFLSFVGFIFLSIRTVLPGWSL